MPEIPFHFEKHLIFIPVVLIHEGKSLRLDRCILDTGSASTAFEVCLAEQIDLRPTPESKIRFLKSIGGKQGFYTRKVEYLQVGGENLTEVEIEIGDLQSEFGIDGIIGNDFLKYFKVTIDYISKTIGLIKTI